MKKMTRRKEVVIVLVNAIATTAVFAIAKNLIGEIAASFLAGVGVGAAIVFVIITNMMLKEERKVSSQ